MYVRMTYSASAMFVAHGIPSFYELLRKCIYNFSERISSSSNSIMLVASIWTIVCNKEFIIYYYNGVFKVCRKLDDTKLCTSVYV